MNKREFIEFLNEQLAEQRAFEKNAYTDADYERAGARANMLEEILEKAAELK